MYQYQINGCTRKNKWTLQNIIHDISKKGFHILRWWYGLPLYNFQIYCLIFNQVNFPPLWEFSKLLSGNTNWKLPKLQCARESSRGKKWVWAGEIAKLLHGEPTKGLPLLWWGFDRKSHRWNQARWARVGNFWPQTFWAGSSRCGISIHVNFYPKIWEPNEALLTKALYVYLFSYKAGTFYKFWTTYILSCGWFNFINSIERSCVLLNYS